MDRFSRARPLRWAKISKFTCTMNILSIWYCILNEFSFFHHVTYKIQITFTLMIYVPGETLSNIWVGDYKKQQHIVVRCFNIILSCKIVDSDWLRDIWWKSISPAKSWKHALTRDGTWQRVILLDYGWYSKKYRLRRIYAHTVHHRFWLASYEHLNLRSTKYKLKYSPDLDCFETQRNVDDVFN